MLEIKGRNVNDIFPRAMMYLRERGEEVSPRGVLTLEYPTPVCTTYTEPRERVFFEPERDANPFFHLFEALWILGGRNDVRFPTLFNSRLTQYSDDGKTFHGAYGYRLRNNLARVPGNLKPRAFDQIEEAIKLLRSDPSTRRCVLSIWRADLDLGTDSADIPCNDMVMLKVRHGALNMTVLNRSNDAIWGCYGANVVQFSILQEYIAARVGVEVGEYRQVSDSFHVYPDNPQWEKLKDLPQVVIDPYLGQVEPYPLVSEPDMFNVELECFLNGSRKLIWYNDFFPSVAIPMWDAWFAHKETKDGARYLPLIKATDWQLACRWWLARRGDVEK